MVGARLHPTAVIDPSAEIGDGVEVGPYAVVGPGVRLGRDARIHAHAVIQGQTTLGPGVQVFSHAVLGTPPQDKKYAGDPTEIVIGERTVLREFVTVHPGSVAGGRTEIGRDTLIMAYCHVAHDCRISDGVVMANAVQLAGHCEVEERAVLGGLTNVHQFARIGRHAMTGAATRVTRDVLPYSLVDGHPARWVGLNTVGLARAGFTADAQRALKRACRDLFTGPFQDQLSGLESEPASPEVARLAAFVRASRRGITRPGRRVRSPPAE